MDSSYIAWFIANFAGNVEKLIRHTTIETLNKNIKIVAPGQTIQSVIDSITDASEDNPYVVIIPPKTYEINSSIIAKSYVHLICPIPFGAIIKATSSFSEPIYKGASHSYCIGLVFNCNFNCKGILLEDLTNLYFEGCECEHTAEIFPYHCWQIANCCNGLFVNCQAEDSGGDDGFSIEDNANGVSHNLRFVNCKSWNHHRNTQGSQDGFEVEDGCHDITFLNCEGWDCHHAGLECHNHAGHDPMYNIQIIGGKYSAVNVVNMPSVTTIHKNIEIVGVIAYRFNLQYIDGFKFDITSDIPEFDTSETIINVSDLGISLANLKNGQVRAKARTWFIIANAENVQGDLQVIRPTSYWPVQLKDACSKLDLNVHINRPTTRPVSALTQDASSGDITVTVSDASKFDIGENIRIRDPITLNSEFVYISAIDIANNTLTFTQALSNDYLIANNSYVEIVGYHPVRVSNLTGENNKIKVNSFDYAHGIDLSSGDLSSLECEQICRTLNTSLSDDLDIRIFEYDKLILDPNGADRNINPVSYWTKGYQLTIINTADAAENLVFDPDGLNLTIGQNQRAIVVYDGSQWLKVYLGS